MSILLDESSMRVWPPRGAGSAAASGGSDEAPPPEEAISIESLVSRAVSCVDEEEKTAALKSDASIDLAGQVPSMKDIWRHPNAHPIVLMLLLLDKYGQEYLEWHPDVLKMTLERDGIALSNKVWNKILAGRVVLMSPSPWRQWEVFHWVSRALSGESPNFVFYEEAEIGHLVVGMEIMKLVDPKRQTSYEVDKFVAAVFKHEGIPFIPAPLDFAQRELEEPKIECTHCLAVHRDDNDVRCVTCGEAKLRKIPFEFEELKAECKQLWDARKKLPLADAVENLPDTGAGSAVYRLLVEWDLVKTVKSQMIQQLRMIGGR
jgi:hypothetical protein